MLPVESNYNNVQNTINQLLNDYPCDTLPTVDVELNNLSDTLSDIYDTINNYINTIIDTFTAKLIISSAMRKVFINLSNYIQDDPMIMIIHLLDKIGNAAFFNQINDYLIQADQTAQSSGDPCQSLLDSVTALNNNQVAQISNYINTIQIESDNYFAALNKLQKIITITGALGTNLSDVKTKTEHQTVLNDKAPDTATVFQIANNIITNNPNIAPNEFLNTVSDNAASQLNAYTDYSNSVNNLTVVFDKFDDDGNYVDF